MSTRRIFKKLGDNAITTFILLISTIIRFFNHKIIVIIGKKFGLLIYLISKKRRSITLDNLRKAFPNKDENWIKRTCKRSFENLGIVFTEIFWLKYANDRKILEIVRCSDKQTFREILERKKGTIAVSAHFGNWELMALSVGMIFDMELNIIVKPQSNKQLDKLINRIRTSRKNKVINMYHSAYEIVKIIKNKGVLALLTDQSATEDKDVYVEFFGRKVATFDAPAQLALKFSIPLVMFFIIRQNDGSYLIEYFEVDYSMYSHSEKGVIDLTQHLSKLLEDKIRQYPEQWVWQHRRWKHVKE